MDNISINQNPDPWSKEDDNTLKIVSLNCAGLKTHFQDIKTDQRLLKAHMIHLLETSVTDKDEEEEFLLQGYIKRFLNVGLGKGIASYYLNDKFKLGRQIKTDKFQIIKFKHEVLDLINVYRSQSGNSVDLLENIKKQIEQGRITIITGDFNICFMENSSNTMVKGLLRMGFDQLVHEPTHIRGRHIDHIYFMDPTKRLKPIIERYSPYYSDHDAMCITIPGLIHHNKETTVKYKREWVRNNKIWAIITTLEDNYPIEQVCAWFRSIIY